MANPPSLIMSYIGSAGGGNTFSTGQNFCPIVQTVNITLFGFDETMAQAAFAAGTASKLQCRVTTGTTSGSSTMVLRINKANGTMAVSIAQGATGAFSASGSDTINDGDLVNYEITAGDANLIITVTGFTFVATNNTNTKLGGYPSGTGAATNTYYMTPSGLAKLNTTEANSKLRLRKAMTVNNMSWMYLNDTGSGNTFTVRSRKNGANGNLTFAMSGSVEKIYQDTTNHDDLVVGDDYNFTVVTTGGFSGNTATNTSARAVDFVSSNGDCIFVCGNDTPTNLTTSTTGYFGLSGDLDTVQTSETAAQVTVNSAFLFDQLICNVVGTNGITGSTTFSLRANQSDVISISIPSQTNGIFNSPLQTTYQASASDLMNYKIVTASTGSSLNISFMSVYGNASAAPAAGGPSYQHFSNKIVKSQQQNYISFGGQLTVFG